MNDKLIQTHNMTWCDRAIVVLYEPSWSGVMSDAYGCDMAHLQVKAVDRDPLPFTETGYRSEFKPVDWITDAGGPVEYVRKWLEDDAKDKAWIEHVDLSRQIDLF